MSGIHVPRKIDKNIENLHAKIVITPETHWDREWYLPFQEFRGRLVQLMDQLLHILKKDPDYANFTLDGQTVCLEDYLEVRDKEDELKKHISEGRISVGPWYVLPDEYLVSGESLVRNLMLGHEIANRFGRVMKAGYVPDPFGHIAQMPQIMAGFEIPSFLFSRGFGNEYDNQHLNSEFIWKAPGDAAEVLGIFLVYGYGSVCSMEGRKSIHGIYEGDQNLVKRVIGALAKHSATNVIILNNGTDHSLPKSFIPDFVKEWNSSYENSIGHMVQADFEQYVKMVQEEIKKKDIKLNCLQGELHGGKYQPVLSGVFSARMWIKQQNNECESILTRYSEPLSSISWMYDTTIEFEYPKKYLWTGWKWLMKNHPHDSICGASIDYIHDVDMKARFGWAKQIGLEIFKTSAIHLAKMIKFDMKKGERFPVFIYNPTPRKTTTKVSIPVIMSKTNTLLQPEFFNITDWEGDPIYFSITNNSVQERYIELDSKVCHFNFIAVDLPAFGIKTYYIEPGMEPEKVLEDLKETVLDGKEGVLPFIENQYYKIVMNANGTFNILDKSLNKSFPHQCQIEDTGDWGDEYDFSGPKPDQQETIVYGDKFVKTMEVENQHISATISVHYDLMLPVGLAPERDTRSEKKILNMVKIAISLNVAEKKIYIKTTLDNQSKDHRLRLLFSSSIVSDQISADGHFYVIPRPIDIPKVENWIQNPLPTHHQRKFVSVSDDQYAFTVLNKGLPEYGVNRKDNQPDGEAIIAITLVRSIGWLSRGDFHSRDGDAGPPFPSPSGQCIGTNDYEIGLTTGLKNWHHSNAHIHAEGFNYPPQVINPVSVGHHGMRILDAILIRKAGLIDFDRLREEENACLPEEFSTCELKSNNFMLTCYKRAENVKDGLIIRLYNVSSKTEQGEIELGKDIASAEIVNLNEEQFTNNKSIKGEILKFANKSLIFKTGPHVIITFLVKFK
jgi:2-O-(6-phospho-alpha-D-mannosyl)-D-glycerate hydrolase